MDTRIFPIKQEAFKAVVEPMITKAYKKPGRPAEISHYLFFCAILYVLRTGIPWRDLPPVYGPWHTIYTRFKRWSENGLFWFLLYHLQQTKKIKMKVVWVDSSYIKVHRHGTGPKKKEENKRQEKV